MIRESLLSALALALFAAVHSNAEGAEPGFKITSTAFAEGKEIPKRFTCDGENVSPPLAWTGAPAGTKAFALILDDPDAPSGLFTHWIVFNLPASTQSLAEGAKPADQGTSGFGKVGYGGPCPPKGRHRYFFHLYALKDELSGLKNPNRKQIDAALKGHVIAEATLMGTYQR
jgi:Raf kinase inhibitor-like YbhB/YbcL family protein